MSYSYLIALGSNLSSINGAPEETLKKALGLLENSGALIRATSVFYHTPAFPAGSGPDYVNAAAFLTASQDPAQFLAILHQVESALGRRRQRRWGERTVDLDLIASGDLVLPDHKTHQHWRDLPLDQQIKKVPDHLLLPHPRVQDRAFVLVPLMDIAPDWVHPVLGHSPREMLEALPPEDVAAVKPL